MRPLFTHEEWQTLVAQCHPAFFKMVWGDVKPRVRVKARRQRQAPDYDFQYGEIV